MFVALCTLVFTFVAILFFFFFNDTATTEIYTLSLHDALPIFSKKRTRLSPCLRILRSFQNSEMLRVSRLVRSEEHTSELQSPCNLVCRLLLEKKKKKNVRDEIHDQYETTTEQSL